MVEIGAIDRGQDEQEKSWSDLPDNLLCEIYSRLLPRDRFVFQSISRSWNSIDALIAAQRLELRQNLECSLYPYLLFSNNRILHPICEECHHMDSPYVSDIAALSGRSYGKFHHINFLDLDTTPGLKIRAAKDGWLLMSLDNVETFFFNPVTKERINLPNIDDDSCSEKLSMLFSSPPTTKDWFVVVIGFTDDSEEMTIWTIAYGGTSWNYSNFSLNGKSFDFLFCNGVVLEGLYYFLGEYSDLLILNPVTHKIDIHEAPQYIRDISNYGGDEQYMLVTGGNLWAVFVECFGCSVSVCQWNILKETWDTLESLGDKVLFVSHPQSFCIRAIVRETANRIYFPRLVGSHCLFYSLTTKRFHTSTFVMDTSYANFGESKEYLSATWLI